MMRANMILRLYEAACRNLTVSADARRDTPLASLTCRIATDMDDWPRLRGDWERLYSVTPDVTPWQSWDFLSRWWQTMRGDRLLRIVVVESAGIVQMILPLQISAMAPLGLRVLEPLGMPDDINRPRLALGMPEATPFAAALSLLWEHWRDWDAIRIDEKQDGDVEVDWLRQFAQSTGSWLAQVPFHACPYLQLHASWNSYIRSRSPRLMKNLRAARRRLGAMGLVTAERADEPRDVLRAFDTLISLHERSWKHVDGVGLSQSESYGRFYREFVSVKADQRQARAWVLKCDSRPIAATLAFHQGSTYFSAQIAHDEAFSHCSPGTLLESIELEDLMSKGRFHVYDFMGGALNNKLRWTSDTRATRRIWCTRPSLRGRVFRLYYFRIKPLLKRMGLFGGVPSSVTEVHPEN